VAVGTAVLVGAGVVGPGSVGAGSGAGSVDSTAVGVADGVWVLTTNGAVTVVPISATSIATVAANVGNELVACRPLQAAKSAIIKRKAPPQKGYAMKDFSLRNITINFSFYMRAKNNFCRNYFLDLPNKKRTVCG
jgi:hypothetical protein